MLKGRFIQYIVYKKFKKGVREFKIDKYYNIRKSSFLNKFANCSFSIHNGKFYVTNDPIYFSLALKDYKNFHFKLGQFSYNKQIQTKGGQNNGIFFLLEDIKKKRGVLVKLKKKKKLIFNRK